MHPQYVAPHCSCASQFDAAPPQRRARVSGSYLLHRASCSFPQGYPQGSFLQSAKGNRQNGDPIRMENRDRRQTCLRASRACLPFPCLPSWQHVAVATQQVTLRNSWSLTRFRSPSSRPSPASTTKPRPGQAVTPVPPCATQARGCA